MDEAKGLDAVLSTHCFEYLLMHLPSYTEKQRVFAKTMLEGKPHAVTKSSR